MTSIKVFAGLLILLVNGTAWAIGSAQLEAVVKGDLREYRRCAVSVAAPEIDPRSNQRFSRVSVDCDSQAEKIYRVFPAERTPGEVLVSIGNDAGFMSCYTNTSCLFRL